MQMYLLISFCGEAPCRKIRSITIDCEHEAGVSTHPFDVSKSSYGIKYVYQETSKHFLLIIIYDREVGSEEVKSYIACCYSIKRKRH